ncbi:hypothetical protein IBX73_06395 [candidate division WOR-3 bacterium]|nr:hypothetical protein [candidate division WOR-3 bacterium]
MKRLFGIAIAMIALVALVGCEGEVALDSPDVTYTVIDQGATLRLSWIEITDADGYYIYADGVVIDTIDNPSITTYDAETPAKLYEVTAYSGEDESAADEIDCAPVITASLDVWDTDQPAPDPSGFGFNSVGTAVAYTLTNQDNWPFIDYYIHGGATTEFWSPHHGNYNDEVNVTKNSGLSNFDAITIADAPGGYLSINPVNSGAVYYFWIDPTDNGWDASTDYFGKIKVEAIDGNKVTMKLAFQPIAGLRWCVTP